MRAFELQEQIREAIGKLDELSAGGSATFASDAISSGDRLATDLDASMQGGKLYGSQLAALVLECCRAAAPLDVSDHYDFASLEVSIEEAEELVGEADALAGKLEARESAIRSVRRVVCGLAMTVAPSRRLQTLVVDVTERIPSLAAIAMSIRWPVGGRDEFYNDVVDGTDLERMLDEFCDD